MNQIVYPPNWYEEADTSSYYYLDPLHYNITSFDHNMIENNLPNLLKLYNLMVPNPSKYQLKHLKLIDQYFKIHIETMKKYHFIQVIPQIINCYKLTYKNFGYI